MNQQHWPLHINQVKSKTNPTDHHCPCGHRNNRIEFVTQTAEMSSNTSRTSVEKIEHFINENLRRDLQRYDEYLNKMNAEIMEYVQLKNTVENIVEHMSDGFKTQVNIGGSFFMSAKVEDTKEIMVNVGLNHYVSFTLVETLKFCDFKVKSLQNEANVIREKSIETRAQIKLALLCLAEKQNI